MSSTSAMGKSAKCSKNLWGSGSPKNTMSGFTMPVHTEQRGTLSTSTSAQKLSPGKVLRQTVQVAEAKDP